MLKFVRNAWIYGFGVLTLRKFDWKKNKGMGNEERLDDVYGQRIFASADVRPRNNTKF